MDIRQIHQRNRAAWNEAASAYEKAIERDIEFLRSGGTNFVRPEYDYLQDLGSWCGRAIHMQCAGGTDTLSLWNMGAREVVGIDISERMIDCARRKSAALSAPARWHCCDLAETPHELDGTADLVYTGRGALCWNMDLDIWAGVAERLLKPGGRLYVFEGHPVVDILDASADHVRLDNEWGDYFSKQVYESRGWTDEYIGSLGKPASEHAPKYERQWTLGQIVTAVIRAGLTLQSLQEHPDAFWVQFPHMPEDVQRRLPMTFSLLAVKNSG